MPTPLNLTGIWKANDGAIYYIRHLSDNSIFWAGLHGYWEFHAGVRFTNVFRGVVDPNDRTITGSWTEVPRGGLLRRGQLALNIIEIAPPPPEPLIIAFPDKLLIPPGPPDGGDPPPNPPPRSRFELRQRPEGTSGGFGGLVWQRARYDPTLSLDSLFDSVKRTESADPLLEAVLPFKDFAVVFGHLGEGNLGIGYNPNRSRDYCSFLRDEDDDGDITFNLQLDSRERQDLDTQPDFWVQSSGWLRPAPEILSRLNETSAFHCELMMYGRENGEDDCTDFARIVFPGWMEFGGDSILVNGLPISGNAIDPPVTITLFPPGDINNPTEPRPQVQVRLQPGLRVRVSGVIARDRGHDPEDHPTRQLEIHPVYAIDLLQDFGQPRPGADLTGVWHANDAGTYYLRQLPGNKLRWLGLSRDQGRFFANVFDGTIEGNIITGEWADVPIGSDVTLSTGHLTLIGNGPGELAAATTLTATERTGKFGGSIWRKLYDRLRSSSELSSAGPGSLE